MSTTLPPHRPWPGVGLAAKLPIDPKPNSLMQTSENPALVMADTLNARLAGDPLAVSLPADMVRHIVRLLEKKAPPD